MATDPAAGEVATRLQAFLDEAQQTTGGAYWGFNPKNVPSFQVLLDSPPEEQIELVLATYTHRIPAGERANLHSHFLSELRGALLRRALPWSEAQIVALARAFARQYSTYLGPEKAVLGTFERYQKDRPLPAEAVAELKSAQTMYQQSPAYGADPRRAVRRLDALVSEGPTMQIVRGEPWANAALARIEGAGPPLRDAWTALIEHALQATAGAPTAKWLKEADKRLDAIGREEFRSALVNWLPLFDKPQSLEDARHITQGSLEPNKDVLKGLVWCCGRAEDRDVARALGTAAASAYKKLPGIGPQAVGLGNACVYALGAMPGMEGLAQLALLKVKVKFGTAQKGIEKSLTAVAERLGLPRDEIEELAVPTYGMDEVGLRREQLGDFTAELTAAADGSTDLRWLKPDGKPQKSVPAAVTAEHAEDVKELKAAAKDIQKMLPAQRDRIDNLFLAGKKWPFATWRERYLDHPLTGIVARRIIWQFTAGHERQAGIWLDGRLVDAADKPLELPDDSIVELWHPIGRPLDEVLAWREWLERHQLRQPFKQAHREVYVLTDAELRTATYSNRFAAHILKQHQYNALCGIRGWKNKLRLMVDDSYPPTSRELPQWGLRAEFWVEGAGDAYGVDTNETGTFLYLATDQVRFYQIGAPTVYAHASGGGYGTGWRQGQPAEPVALDQVPPLVFSEIMRDIDLFVGVASVGNDPNWADGGREVRYANYWNEYSFGELSATAQTRREVLQKIIPRLKIAGRCSFAERFLVVQGKLRTYKIHLGSGNILMEPNDQYLCIVPGRSSEAAADNVFLPFEGDRTLSIILSKALLLADDDKITDPTITRQIKGN